MNADCAEFVPRTSSGYTFMVRSGDGRRSSTSMVDRVVLDDELAQITFDASNASGVIQIDRNRKSFQQQLHSEQTEIEEINYKFYAQFHHKDLNMQIAPKLSQKKKTSNPANSYNKLWIPPAYLMYAAPLPWPCQYPPYDTLQRSSSNGNQQQSTLANCEITNELVINHNQKLSGSKSSKGHHRSNLGGRDGGGGSSKRHDKVMNSSTPHPWLVTTLKGHTDQIRDVGFSGNGKYLASCGEDPDAITNSHNAGHRNSASSDATNNDDIMSSSSEDSPIPSRQKEKLKIKSNKVGRNRRHRKNHHNHHPNNQQHGSNRSSLSNEADDESKENQHPFSKRLISTCRKHTKSWSSTYSNNSSLSSSPQMSTGNETKQRMFQSVSNFDDITRALTPPLRQHTKLNLPEAELVKYLKNYVIDPNQLKEYGYPTEYEIDPNRTVIYKNWPRIHYVGHTYDLRSTQNAKMIVNVSDGLEKPIYKPQGTRNWKYNSSDNVILLSGDSGQGSGSSSPPSIDSDNYEMADDDSLTTANNDVNCNIAPQLILNNSTQEKKCVRCHREFFVTNDGEYLTQERCVFHWGKLERVYCGEKNRLQNEYTCCNGDQNSKGCTENRLHVWTGISNGVNGPFNGFVRTRPKCNTGNEEKNDDECDDYDDLDGCIWKIIANKSRRNVRFAEDMRKVEKGAVYALDCEMCFTGFGLEVTKVTVVGADGRLVYEHYVRPESEIVDYNTRFSGVSEKDLSPKNASVKTLKQVQNDLLQLFDADTILIGHALDNDLRVLKMIHKNVIDTSISFPHFSGFPYRRSLKNLAKTYLKRDIQTCENGHSSFEDSRACLELMLWRVRKDFRTVLET